MSDCMKDHEQYDEAIIRASSEIASSDIQRILSPFSNTGCLDGLPTPLSRESQKLLAGILLREDKVAKASQILTSRLPNVSDLGDALVIDPGLMHYDGHHFNTNVFYQRLLEESGLRVSVLRSMSQHPSLNEDETESIPTFAMSPYEKLFPTDFMIDSARKINDLFFYEFKYKLPKWLPKYLVVHTATHNFIEGFCRYLATTGVSDTKLVLGIIEIAGLDKTNPLYNEIKGIYQRAFSTLRALRNLKLLIVVETLEVANYLRELAGVWPEIKVIHYLGGYVNDFNAPVTSSNSKPVIGFVGQTRPERGALLIPYIAAKILKQKESAVTWKAQLNLDVIRRHADQDIDDVLNYLDQSTDFNYVEQNLPIDEYHSLLASIDIMVMPYSTRYNSTGSGVNIESLRYGHIQVVPEGSSMLLAVKAHQSSAVTFSVTELDRVTDAILKAVDNYDVLRKRALRASHHIGSQPRPWLEIQQFINNS